jgi:hypothetical protein
MGCALRVVIILVICSSISSAMGLLVKVQDQENQFGGNLARIVAAIKRYLTQTPGSEENLRRYWSLTEDLIAHEHLSSLGSLHRHGAGEDQKVEVMSPDYVAVQSEERNSASRKSSRDGRIVKEEGETVPTVPTVPTFPTV